MTRLPSTKLLEQQLSRHHAVSVSLLSTVPPKHWSSSPAPEASLLTFFHSSLAQWRTLRARSLEALLERQAKVRLAAFHPPLAVPGCQASGVTFCRRVMWCHSRAERVEEHRERQHVLAGGVGRKLAMLGRERGRAEGPSSATLRLLVQGSSSPVALSAAGLLSEHSLVLAG